MGFFIRDESLLYNSSSISSLTYDDLQTPYNETTLRAGSPVVVFGNDGDCFILDEVSSDDNGTDVVFEYETIDFTVPEVHQSLLGRWIEVEFDARGEEVEVSYSSTNGSAFTSIGSVTLTGQFERQKLYFDTTSEKIRLKFSSTGKYFQIRWIRIWGKPKGPR
jgi:hypothetical protein